jgi:hypothetical protein
MWTLLRLTLRAQPRSIKRIHFAVFQIEINPPRPHSSSTLTAIAPLF